MIVTAELSLYPLKDTYETPIIFFIKTLKEHENVSVDTHAMSTFVKGEQRHVFDAIDSAMNAINKDNTYSLVIKIINRDLPVEKGFLKFD